MAESHFGILVWPYQDNEPVWEACDGIGRYSPFHTDAKQFRTKKEAEGYADREIRRFGLRAEVRRFSLGCPRIPQIIRVPQAFRSA